MHKELLENIEEVRTNYHDDEEQFTCVDVWFQDDEQGVVAARVYDNGYVEWNDEMLSHQPEVVKAVVEILNKNKN